MRSRYGDPLSVQFPISVAWTGFEKNDSTPAGMDIIMDGARGAQQFLKACDLISIPLAMVFASVIHFFVENFSVMVILDLWEQERFQRGRTFTILCMHLKDGIQM